MKNRRIILSIVLIVFYKYSYSQDFYDIKINYLKSNLQPNRRTFGCLYGRYDGTAHRGADRAGG